MSAVHQVSEIAAMTDAMDFSHLSESRITESQLIRVLSGWTTLIWLDGASTHAAISAPLVDFQFPQGQFQLPSPSCRLVLAAVPADQRQQPTAVVLNSGLSSRGAWTSYCRTTVYNGLLRRQKSLSNEFHFEAGPRRCSFLRGLSWYKKTDLIMDF